MDLLAGYGSGSDDEGDSPKQLTRKNASISAAAPDAGPALMTSSTAAAAKPKPSLFASVPGPKSAAPVVSSTQSALTRLRAPADLPPGFFDTPAEAPATRSIRAPAGVPSDFFDAAPAARAGTEAEPADEADVGPAVRPPRSVPEDLPAPTETALWSKLPAPKAAAGKRKVLFRPQINLELLAASDSDDNDAPAAKKAKPTAAAAGKPSILSFLPAPKHAPAGPSGTRLVTGKQQKHAGLMSSTPAHTQQQQHDAGNDAAGQQAATGPVMDSNEQYRLVRPAAADAGYGAQDESSYDHQQQQYSTQQYEQYYSSSAAAATYGYSAYGYDASAAAAAAAPATASAATGGSSAYLPPEEALLQEALQAEAAKVARRNAGAGSSQLVLPDIQFKEVKADKIKYVDPSQREAAQGMRAALGTEYAAKLRAEAAPHVGSRLARSKHQIGTLFANAKLRELEILENRAAGMKSKSETAGKYGWR